MQPRICLEHPLHRLPGFLEHPHIPGQIRHPELGQSVLAGAEEIPRPPELQILLSDAEAVIGGAEGLKTAAGLLASVVGN